MSDYGITPADLYGVDPADLKIGEFESGTRLVCPLCGPLWQAGGLGGLTLPEAGQPARRREARPRPFPAFPGPGLCGWWRMSGPKRPTRCGMQKCTSGLAPRPYPEGWRCPKCTPSARAGVPEPDELVAIAKERRAEVAAALRAEVAG